MRLQYMKELTAIYEKGNFSKAAKSLFITQPALSRHVADMEKQLGVTLLDRDKHSVTFTEAGLKVYKSFRRILQIYEHMQEELFSFQSDIAGTLRLGMLYYTIRQDFGPVLSRLTSDYPHIEIKQISCQPQDVYHALETDRIDIGVLGSADYPDSSFLKMQEFSSSTLDVMMSAQHPLTKKASLTFKDIHDEIFIQLSDDPYSNRSYNEALKKCGFECIKTILTPNIDTVPFVLQNTNAIYLKASQFTVSGYENVIVTRPLDEKNLLVHKAYAYREDNQNPLIPLFLEYATKFNTDLL